jgi:hypothetical protein
MARQRSTAMSTMSGNYSTDLADVRDHDVVVITGTSGGGGVRYVRLRGVVGAVYLERGVMAGIKLWPYPDHQEAEGGKVYFEAANIEAIEIDLSFRDY